MFKLYEVKLTTSTTYHPQMDGQTERVNQCLKMYLRCAIHDSPKQWKKWLPLVELWYNSSFHSALRCSPYKAVYAYKPNLVLAPNITTETTPRVAELIQDRELHIQSLKGHLAVALVTLKSPLWLLQFESSPPLKSQPSVQIATTATLNHSSVGEKIGVCRWMMC